MKGRLRHLYIWNILAELIFDIQLCSESVGNKINVACFMCACSSTWLNGWYELASREASGDNTKGLKFRNRHITCQLPWQVNGINSQQGLNTLFKHLQFSPDKNLHAAIQSYHLWYWALRPTEWTEDINSEIPKRDNLINKSSTALIIKVDFFFFYTKSL